MQENQQQSTLDEKIQWPVSSIFTERTMNFRMYVHITWKRRNIIISCFKKWSWHSKKHLLSRRLLPFFALSVSTCSIFIHPLTLRHQRLKLISAISAIFLSHGNLICSPMCCWLPCEIIFEETWMILWINQ